MKFNSELDKLAKSNVYIYYKRFDHLKMKCFMVSCMKNFIVFAFSFYW